jgi:hypothetical protein
MGPLKLKRMPPHLHVAAAAANAAARSAAARSPLGSISCGLLLLLFRSAGSVSAVGTRAAAWAACLSASLRAQRRCERSLVETHRRECVKAATGTACAAIPSIAISTGSLKFNIKRLLQIQQGVQ